MPRFWRGVGLALLVTLVVDVLLNAVAFRDIYEGAAHLLLPADQLNARVPLGWAAMIVITVGYAWLYDAEAWPWPHGALRFGAIIAGMGVAGVMGIASVFPWPPALVAAMATQQALNGITLGVVLGLVSRRERS